MFEVNKENLAVHFSKRCNYIVISTAGSPQVAPLRINLNTLIVLQSKISPCGRNDRIDKPFIPKENVLRVLFP